MKPAALLALAACAPVTGCAPYEIEDTRRVVIESWVQESLLPSYVETRQELTTLQARIDALCAAPDAASTEAARDAWRAARGPWKRTEVFAFGPYQEEPLRLGPKIDAWPARPDTVDALLADDIPLSALTLDGAGVFAKGFPALEYLLFAPDDLPAALAAEPRRCDYLTALTENLADEVGALETAWRPDGGDYLAQLTAAGATSVTYDSLSEALGEVVNRMGFTVENIQLDKLGRPLGTAASGPQPALAESRFSGRSLDDIRDNLAGIERLFFETDPAEPALETYLRKRGRHLGPPMRALLDDVYATIDAIEEPLVIAIADDPASVHQLIDRLRVLQTFLQTDLIMALSLTLGFNDADGD